AAAGDGRQAAFARLCDGVGELAIDVELELESGRVADAHRLRFLVAGEPVDFPFIETPLAGHAVHGLDLVRAAGNGADEPLLPLRSLLGITGVEEGKQG